MSEIKTRSRPLSPFMLGSAYRFQLTSFMSIMHRITGIALAAGLIPFTWWLVSLASGPAGFADFRGFAESGIGQLMLAGWAFSLIYHLLNGIRHLMWDTGRGLDIDTTYRTGWMVMIGSVIVTALLLLSAYSYI